MMEHDISVGSAADARDKWNQARRKAFWQRISHSLGLTRKPVDLLSFDEVQEKLRLHQNAYRGLQEVPLDKIVGSVGRYHDFTRTFLPLIEEDSVRWRRIAELQNESGLPPIELYKVGDAYFVKDGNHRVSVARQFGATTIEAYVWEYQTRLGDLSADIKVDDLIGKAEYRAFLDRTHLDITRPDVEIVLTEPGMYPQLELQIELYRQNLERIDGEPRSYETAAEAWYDLVYTLAVDVIRESGVMDLFPDRTEADVYVWVSKHRRELSERYGEQVSLRDAVEKLAESQRKQLSPVERVVQSAARSVADFVSGLTSVDSAPDIEADRPPEMPDITEPLGRLLAEMSAVKPAMAYNGQRGDAWRTWRGEVRGKVWDLLGMDYTPADDVPVEIIDSTVISGVERVKIRLVAADGLMLPGYVMSPVDVPKPKAGLLVYPGHGSVRNTAGLEPNDLYADALALAQAGFVTLTLEERGVGELGQVDHTALDDIARLIGKTWMGITLSDGLRGMDYLRSRPDVDETRLGVTGLGLGGGLALYTAAFDERVRAVVIGNYLGGGIDPLEVLGHGCDFVPSLRQYAEIGDVARLIAPRPALYLYPENRYTTVSARQFFDQMRPSYEVFSCPDRTNFVAYEPATNSRETAEWFHRWLTEERDTSVLLWAPRE